MVCQAASQTRFRALKHESGIAGSATIIVRVIACFQPLCRIPRKTSSNQYSVIYNFCYTGDCCGWMENDFGSWFRHQIFDRQSSNLNALGAPFDIGLWNTILAHMSSCPNVLPTKENAIAFPVSEVRHFNAGQKLSEPQGWFYCLPRFHQAFTPAPSSPFSKKNSLLVPIQKLGVLRRGSLCLISQAIKQPSCLPLGLGVALSSASPLLAQNSTVLLI